MPGLQGTVCPFMSGEKLNACQSGCKLFISATSQCSIAAIAILMSKLVKIQDSN